MKKPWPSAWSPLALALVMSCRPPIIIVRQATPNPFRGGATFALAPLDFSRLTIDGMPPSVWLLQNGRNATALHSDLARAQLVFQASAIENGGGMFVTSRHGFVVHGSVGAWSRGYFNYFTNPSTTVALNVRITTRRGAVLDEIWLTCRASHSLIRPTPVQGLHVAMEGCGEQLAEYLQRRRLALLRASRAIASRPDAPPAL